MASLFKNILSTLPIVGDVMDMYSASRDRASIESQASLNTAYQKEFAKSGIQWKVADAKKAGISPLAALGANTMSYTPITVGKRDRPSMGRMGQNIQTAVTKMLPSDEKSLARISLQQEQEKLKQMGLETVILENQVKLLLNPSAPSMTGNKLVDHYNLPGAGNIPYSSVAPEVDIMSKPGVAAGTRPQEQQVMDTQGNIDFKPTKDMAEVLESSAPDYIKYSLGRGSAYLNAIKHLYNKYPGPDTQKFHKRMSELRPASPAGWVYLLNPVKERWEPVRTKNAKHWLYKNPKAWHLNVRRRIGKKKYNIGVKRPIF